MSIDKIEFLLIIAPVDESYPFARATFKVAEEYKVSARVCILWPAGTKNGVEDRSKTALAPWQNYVDVVEVRRSENSLSWWGICQMTDKGAILVRPDDHIAWRSKSGLTRDPVSEIRRAFSAALGIN